MITCPVTRDLKSSRDNGQIYGFSLLFFFVNTLSIYRFLFILFLKIYISATALNLKYVRANISQKADYKSPSFHSPTETSKIYHKL